MIMFLMRKANMTLNQSLKLCQRRRSVVDPNCAFVGQLRTYEKECREWGHLTSVDPTPDNANATDQDIGAAKRVSVEGVSGGNSAGAEKRKAHEGVGDGKKRRTAGPRGPPRGPARSVVVGPAAASREQGNRRVEPAAAADTLKGGGRKDEMRVVGPMAHAPTASL